MQSTTAPRRRAGVTGISPHRVWCLLVTLPALVMLALIARFSTARNDIRVPFPTALAAAGMPDVQDVAALLPHHILQPAPPARLPGPALRAVRHAQPAVTVTNQSVWLVVSYNNEDISWLVTHVPHLTPVVIAANTSGAAYQQLHPACREAGAFLYFLVAFYDSLPDLVAFVHAHRRSYHTYEGDIVATLQRVKWDSIKGYTPLNLKEYNRWKQGYANWDWIVANWKEFFSDFGDTVPEYADGYCCAQFVVPRATIRRHPRAVYERLLAFVADVAHYSERDPPRIMEHMWHMVFGQPAAMSPIPVCDVLTC